MMTNVDVINHEGLQQHLIEGAYVRALTLKPGTMVISSVWAKERLWIITQGDFTYQTTVETRRVRAPYIQLAQFGERVQVVAQTETTIIAVTGTKATTLEDVQLDVIKEV